MTPTKIRIKLKSAATFARGDGVAGLVDREIEHDDNGFPFMRGKTLKGLLAESAENILFALKVEEKDSKNPWRQAKNNLFGLPGRGDENERGILHIGDAQLPEKLRTAILYKSGLSKSDVLYSLTSIRRQTAINPDGAPDNASLRSMRVLLRGITLEAPIDFENLQLPNQQKDENLKVEYQLLAATVLDFRHAGTGRNRGRGWLEARLDDDKTTQEFFEEFANAIRGVSQ